MKRKSEGVRRLSILIGALTAFAWFLFVFFGTRSFRDPQTEWVWVILFVGLAVCFFIPLILTRSVYWVVIGFKQDKSESDVKDKNEVSED